MRQIITLLLVLALVAGLWLLSRSAGEEGGVGVRPPADDGGESSPAVPDEPTVLEADSMAPTEALEATRKPTRDLDLLPAGETIAAGDEPQETRSLRGILLEAESSRVMAGYRLGFRRRWRGPEEGGLLAQATTKEDGSFLVSALPCSELVVLHLAEPDNEARSVAVWIEPFGFMLPPSDKNISPAEPFEVVLRARPPGFVVEVDVLAADGSPAIGAAVQLAYEAKSYDGSSLSNGGVTTTNSRGRARLGLHEEAFQEGVLHARGEDGSVSEYLSIAGAEAGAVHRLTLGAAAELEVRVRLPDGSVVPERLTRLATPARMLFGEEAGWQRGQPTDGAGRCRFSGLHPGTYTVLVANRRTGGEDRREVELARAEVRILDFVMSEGSRRLAAAGRVIDETDRPIPGIEIQYRVDGEWSEEVKTGSDGRFECWTEPARTVWLGVDLLPEGDPFEPRSTTVPFGTTDLVFRRTAVFPERRFRIEAFDRLTGEPVEPFYATFDLGSGSEEWSNTYAPRDVFRMKVRPETRCRIGAEGFVSATLDLGRVLSDEQVTDEPVLRVDLLPGLDCELFVLDADTLEPLADVRFVSPTAPEAHTDQAGRVRLAADHWSLYEVVKRGYAKTIWDPAEEVLFDYGPFHLWRVD